MNAMKPCAAPRLRAFLALFPNRSTSITLCQQDLSGVLQLQGELLGGRDYYNPCFDLEVPEPPDCAMSAFFGSEMLVPPCEDDASGLCWRLEVEPANCPGSMHQLVQIDHYVPTARRVPAVIECALPSVL